MITPEEYTIYSKVFESDLFEKDRVHVFMNVTSNHPAIKAPLEFLTGTIRYRCMKHQSLLDDFAAKNQTPEVLEKKFCVPDRVELLPERKLESPGRKYGVFTFSRVGFNSLGTLGLIYVDFHGGPLFGFGNFITIEKSELGWHIKDTYRAWVS